MADDSGNNSQSSSSSKNFELTTENENVGMNEDSGITMVDVLEKEQELDEDANAVLGGSDDQNCTYPSGYIKRQALYACSTCMEKTSNKNTKHSGICLACSYSCHEGHRLFELYTKRNFRCDCGNSKFSPNPCKLYPEKDDVNSENNYNQNFDGVYCTCSRPYPDPDDEIEDEMIQCIICEDWYHGRHLGCSVPANNEYGEMVCGNCMDKCEFLLAYSSDYKKEASEEVCEPDEGVETIQEIDVEDKEPSNESSTTEASFLCIPHCTLNVCDSDANKQSVSCLWKGLSESMPKKRAKGTATFFADGWRSKLCTCFSCKERYSGENVMFLLDDDDTVHHYEEQGKAKNCPQTRYDQGMQALSQLDRVRQVEAIHGYNDMKMELLDFLKDFAERKKVVRKEDIDEFFNQMQAKKRRRLDVSIPQFCR